MPFCPKCGNNVDKTMAFCPKCGTMLKDATPNQEADVKEKEEKPETHENAATVEMHHRSDYGFISYFMGGLIMIVLGVFAVLDLSSPSFASGENLTIMLLMIGAIIIVGTVFRTAPTRKYFQQLFSHLKKEPAKI